MAQNARQFIPQPLRHVRVFFLRIMLKPHKEGDARGAGLLIALQPVEQQRGAAPERMRDFVSGVESSKPAKHRVSADVLAVMADRGD